MDMDTVKEILTHIIHLPVWIILTIVIIAMVICYLKGYHDGVQERKYSDD